MKLNDNYIININIKHNGNGMKDDYIQLYCVPCDNWIICGFNKKNIKYENFQNNEYNYEISVIPLETGIISFPDIIIDTNNKSENTFYLNKINQIIINN